MPYTAVITTKGQVTIPKPIRDLFGFLPSTQISFTEELEQVIIKPVVDFLSLKGSIKSGKRYSDKKADKAILKFVAKNNE